MPESVFLRVAEAIQADVGTGKARIDTATRKHPFVRHEDVALGALA